MKRKLIIKCILIKVDKVVQFRLIVIVIFHEQLLQDLIRDQLVCSVCYGLCISCPTFGALLIILCRLFFRFCSIHWPHWLHESLRRFLQSRFIFCLSSILAGLNFDNFFFVDCSISDFHGATCILFACIGQRLKIIMKVYFFVSFKVLQKLPVQLSFQLSL